MKNRPLERFAGINLSRRSALTLAVGSLATTVATGSSTAARGARLDPSRPEDAWQIHRKMQLRTDSGLVFWWIRGPSFGQVGADLTPLYELNHGLIQRVSQRAGGAATCDRSRWHSAPISKPASR
jgi:hypothetical protein